MQSGKMLKHPSPELFLKHLYVKPKEAQTLEEKPKYNTVNQNYLH